MGRRRPPAPGPRTPPLPNAGPRARGPLLAIVHARSGDKGDTANTGLIGRSPGSFAWLARHNTAARVNRWLAGVALDRVHRHLVPTLWTINFLLDEALGGGSTRSLRLGAQGKTFAQALLHVPVTVPAALPRTIAEADRPCPEELLSARRRERA